MPGIFPTRLIEPEQHHGSLALGRPLPRQRQQLPGRPGRLHVAVGERRPGPRQMDVRVDEAGQDGGARELHDPIRVRRVAAPHALDVAVVDQDPLAGLRMRQGVHARRAIEGPHVARLSQR